MRYLPQDQSDPNVIVGLDHADDGSVYKLTDDIALIQTVDFFTPVVNDPYKYGQIAAANSLSDVYAMGGTPKTVLNIVAYPMPDIGPEILAKILQGSSDKVKEAGAQVVGGHSVIDNEPKFGLSVTGIVHPDKFYRNTGAKPGDVLILTKPIGIGILTTAIKRGVLSEDKTELVTEVMCTLNKYAAETLKDFHPHAVTDVTGFGLLGHAYEMAKGSHVSLVIENEKVPVLPGTKELAEEHVIPGGSWENHRWLIDVVQYPENMSEVEQVILCDAITSGGLLISLPIEEAQPYIQQLKNNHDIEAKVIGEVIEQKEKAIYVK
ncbi:selenide,water dikinase [Cerasibacillus quisquiliarum]|uniref:Selenide, water dikinase n=1 Tax=Cerasibacillus quisquiliarum TaxID=227865 RepID=A0A511V1Q0_9BACI|nr:selenide,water dikinase [Cerasibacillus quisquiliarum]GEN31683.1 selenide, water dikinase [Cerasibacillus quisquiliarum]